MIIQIGLLQDVVQRSVHDLKHTEANRLKAKEIHLGMEVLHNPRTCGKGGASRSRCGLACDRSNSAASCSVSHDSGGWTAQRQVRRDLPPSPPWWREALLCLQWMQRMDLLLPQRRRGSPNPPLWRHGSPLSLSAASLVRQTLASANGAGKLNPALRRPRDPPGR